MDPQVLTDLEFHAVLSLVREAAVTPPGAAAALALRPLSDRGAVAKENALSAEAMKYLDERGSLPFGALPDPEPLLARLEVEGSVLAPLEILDLLAAMKRGREVRAALGEARAGFPRLWEEGRAFPEIGNLIRFLDGAISGTGQIDDRASDELRAVRQDLRRRGARLQEALEAIRQRPEVARALQDDFISLRSERHVVPIRVEAQGALPGIVHGVSGSGATVFVEPLETVELNNAIVTLREREAAETRRLLREYSELLRGRRAELRALVAALGRLDLIQARARVGRALHGRVAKVSSDGTLCLEAARHPLVEASLRERGGRIVPLDLRLDPGTAVLVLSGPNTGGKTVALKTVGLLALMFQSGVPVPAADAVLPVFRSIGIDIGDRQSISDRLSSFSGRLRAVAAMAAGLALPGLVLLDEAGAGTDPEDGVALGIAITDGFRRRGATVIATTHMEALKAYAADTPGCANAAMEFDESTSTPTYRLTMGLPGRSGGLEIAARLGLPEDIIADARARRGQAAPLIASYLARLQELSAAHEARLREVAEVRRGLEEERAALAAESRSREERQRQALQAEIEMALGRMREAGERYLQTLKGRAAAALRRQEARLAAPLRAEARRLIRRTAGPEPGTEAAIRLQPGMAVRVEGMGLRGTIEAIQQDRVILVVRGKRLTVARADCRVDAGGATPGPARLPAGVTLARRPGPAVPDAIDLRGLAVEEALARADKYLDDACLAGLSPVRLVHGVGSGRLGRALAEFLARHPHVEAIESAAPGEGGAGLTVVRLRL